MVINNEYEDFIKFTLNFLLDLVGKVISIRYRVLGKITHFCNPDFCFIKLFCNNNTVLVFGCMFTYCSKHAALPTLLPHSINIFKNVSSSLTDRLAPLPLLTAHSPERRSTYSTITDTVLEYESSCLRDPRQTKTFLINSHIDNLFNFLLAYTQLQAFFFVPIILTTI
jgi:hypothetical protein